MLQHNKKGEKFQPNTFVDGVHVKISEQYKPPRRVVLPVSCQNCSPGEALYSEYDFKLEENILNKLAEWKTARRVQVERRKERLKAETKVCEEIDHFRNVTIDSGESEGITRTTTTTTTTTTTATTTITTTTTATTTAATTEQTQTHDSLINRKLTDSVLTPICAKQNSPSHKPVSSKFNLSDFESDNSSPFDNMELKTINDMEVLASILTTNNMEQSIHNNNNNNNNNNNDKDVGKNCIVLNNKNTEWGFAALNGYTSIGYFNSDYDSQHTVGLQQHHHHHHNNQGKDFNQYGFYPIREHIQISNYGLNDFSNQFGAAVASERAAAYFNRQEPNELGKGKPSGVKKGRSREEDSKSVPDIMLELEKELQESREREEELERRNKLAYLKQTILSSSLKEKRQLPESSRRIHGGTAFSKLPDPSSTLSPSSQKLVRYISEMGFPADRVGRACQLFGGDDKKIIEFLIQIQILEEKNYPGDLIEKALVLNNFKLTESLRHLEAMVLLLDLGFDEEKAEKALLAADSDRDKALDMLIS